MRGEGETPDSSLRADRANGGGAAAFVSFHLGVAAPGDDGPTVFHWGTPSTHSPAGRRLAELIRDRLLGVGGIVGMRVAPLAVAVLRETRMPAVIVEPRHLRDGADEKVLRDAGFATAVATAVADALDAFLSASDPGAGAGVGGDA